MAVEKGHVLDFLWHRLTEEIGVDEMQFFMSREEPPTDKMVARFRECYLGEIDELLKRVHEELAEESYTGYQRWVSGEEFSF